MALSIRNLAFKYKAVSARFWGKILGLENDYYVPADCYGTTCLYPKTYVRQRGRNSV